jgi:hypothetical protein
MTESKFGLLHYRKYQKTLCTTQQLRGSARAWWWATYTATLSANHHVSWGEFHNAFRAHNLSVGLLCIKLKDFEGPEKVSRGGVNGSQSKFLVETWSISQIEPDTPLFQHEQDHITIGQLLTLRIGFVTAEETRVSASKTTCKIYH